MILEKMYPYKKIDKFIPEILVRILQIYRVIRLINHQLKNNI
jgi:hypothetical protein